VQTQQALGVRNAHAQVRRGIHHQQRHQRVELGKQAPAPMRVRRQLRIHAALRLEWQMPEAPKHLRQAQQADASNADEELRVRVRRHGYQARRVANEGACLHSLHQHGADVTPIGDGANAHHFTLLANPV